MTERRGSRFLIEVLFLLLLAGALTFAQLSALQIAGVMLLGWVIVAVLEWAAWRGEPHYGSGLPPRYYVPSVNLPPAQPLEQVAVGGYPDASRDEAPTWIAPAALREQMLGEWPVSGRVAPEPEPETPEPGPAEPDVVPELELEPEPEPEPEVAYEPVPLPPVTEIVPIPAPAAEPEPEPVPTPTIDVVLTQSAQRVARYTFDPLAEPAPKRRFGRGGGGDATPAVQVPARPEGVRVLPGRSSRQD
ncbi:MAG TPA: hypothetical protein VFB25_07190 [Gaiellaceae bacterium]|nr:hypothetical protein [Gaiellaceae bacterium]